MHSDCSADYEDFDARASSSNISSDIEESGSKNASSVLPEKSRIRYEMTYDRFEQWCKEMDIKNEVNEKVMLAYFEHKAKSHKSSSLWSNYSMLRAVISMKQNVDIGKYKHLNAFLRKQSTGYEAKKSRILTKEDVTKFLTEAHDDRYLLMKVVLIIGLGGACRKEELTNLVLDNVHDKGEYFRIAIPNPRTKALQEFFITPGDIEGLNMVEIIRKYVSLRPAHTDHRRFFVGYREGKCTKQPVGINTFGNMPKVIAAFLKLPKPEDYTDCSASSDYEDFDARATSSNISSDIEESDTKDAPSVLPEKSRPRYECAYERFEQWCVEMDIKNEVNEKLMLAYFEHKAKTQKSSSLWSNFSMLRAVISMKQNVDIGKYKRLTEFLKEKSVGYQAKKSKTFTRQDVAKFLIEADDSRFLLMKVALIIGLGGACRREELTNLVSDNVQDEGKFFRIVMPNARTKEPQEFFITPGDMEGLNMVEIIRKYVALRPAHTDHRRFFVGYRRGKCTTQPVGKNTFGTMPKIIASFLKLPNPEEYPSHCFRISSSSFKR